MTLLLAAMGLYHCDGTATQGACAGASGWIHFEQGNFQEEGPVIYVPDATTAKPYTPCPQHHVCVEQDGKVYSFWVDDATVPSTPVSYYVPFAMLAAFFLFSLGRYSRRWF